MSEDPNAGRSFTLEFIAMKGGDEMRLAAVEPMVFGIPSGTPLSGEQTKEKILELWNYLEAAGYSPALKQYNPEYLHALAFVGGEGMEFAIQPREYYPVADELIADVFPKDPDPLGEWMDRRYAVEYYVIRNGTPERDQRIETFLWRGLGRGPLDFVGMAGLTGRAYREYSKAGWNPIDYKMDPGVLAGFKADDHPGYPVLIQVREFVGPARTPAAPLSSEH